MKEGKNIKKFIFSFYGIMLLCIILFNLIWFPSIKESRIKEVKKILTKNKTKLHKLAKFLYERKTITGEEFMQILNAGTAI